jgi:hypothetical protein
MMLDEDSTTRLNSIWFGRGEQLKLKAFHLAQRMLLWPESRDLQSPGSYRGIAP